MGQIFVEGLGTVEIKGDTPTAVEAKVIANALKRQSQVSRGEAQPDPEAPEATTPPPEKGSGTSLTQQAMLTGGLAGAQYGATAGLGGGPAAPLTSTLGALGGGILGTMAGYSAAEGVKSVANGKLGEAQTPEEIAKGALKEGAIDAGIGMGTSAVSGPVAAVGRTIKRKLLGVTEKSAEKFQTAKNAGINLGVMDVSESGLVSKSGKVMGGFPFFGKPLKEAKARQVGEAAQEADRLFLQVGAPRSLVEKGIDIANAAKNTFDGVIQSINERYYHIAEQAGKNAIVPTTPVAKAAKEIVEELDASNLKLVTRGEKGKFQLTDREKLVKDSAYRFAKSLEGLSTKNMTWEQFQGLGEEIDKMMARSTGKGNEGQMARLLKLRGALEEAGNNITDPTVRSLYQEANDFTERAMRTFDNPTAAKVGKIDKNMFSANGGIPTGGTLNSDELFQLAFNSKSPKAMDDLKNLIGEQGFKDAVATHLDNAFSSVRQQLKAVQEGKGLQVNFKQFSEDLGLNDPNGAKYKALAKALDNTGLDINQLKKFTEVADEALKNLPPDVSSFVARRGVLGGLRSVIHALTPFAVSSAVAAGASPTVGLHNALWGAVGVLGVRGMFRHLTNPQVMEDLLKANTPNVSDAVRRAATLRFLNSLPDMDPERPDVQSTAATGAVGGSIIGRLLGGKGLSAPGAIGGAGLGFLEQTKRQ